VVAEGELIQHVYYVGLVVSVLFTKIIQNTNFFLRLTMKTPLIPYNLDRDVDVILMISCFNDLTKTTFAEYLNERHVQLMQQPHQAASSVEN
jgi:hypothetical protein